MEEFNDLVKCKQIAEIYLEYSNKCRKEVFADQDIAFNLKQRFNNLLSDFTMQLKDFIERLSYIQEQIKVKPEYYRKYVKGLLEEFKEIRIHFDHLPSISETIPNIKSQIKAKLNLCGETVIKKTMITRVYKTSKNKSEVEKNIDNLLVGISTKNERLKELEKLANKHNKYNAVPYLKMTHGEFIELKDSLHDIKSQNKSHKHPIVTNQLDKLSEETLKIGTDTKIIQREHSKLSHNIHLLSTFPFNCSETSRIGSATKCRVKRIIK